MWKELQRSIGQMEKLDAGQLAVAICTGVRIEQAETGLTLTEKIATAEISAETTPATTAQRSLASDVGIDLPDQITRAVAAHQLLGWYHDHQREFFQRISPTHQTAHCGGRLDRFDCLTMKLMTTQSIARGCVMWIAIVGVSLLVFWIVF